MWMLRGWRTQQGRGHGSVDGVEVEGAGKRDEVGDTRNGVPIMVPVWRFTRGGSGTWRQYRVVVGQACGIGYVESPNVRRGQGWSKRWRY